MKFSNKLVQGLTADTSTTIVMMTANIRALVSEDDWDMSDTNTKRCYQVPSRYLIIIIIIIVIIVNIPCGHILYIIYSCG